MLPAREHAGLAHDDEEALGAHVALVHEDGAGLGVDGLAEGLDLRNVALVHVGEQREATEILDHRLVDLV